MIYFIGDRSGEPFARNGPCLRSTATSIISEQIHVVQMQVTSGD